MSALNRCMLYISIVTVCVCSCSPDRQTQSELDNLQDKIRAQGYPVTLEELDAWYAPVPEGQNAATVVLQAGEALQSAEAGAGDPKQLMQALMDLPPTKPVSEEWIKAATAYVESHAKTFELLARLPAMSEARYPIDLKKGMAAELPDLASIREVATAALLAAELRAADNDFDGFVEAHYQALSVARTLAREPVLISQFVRIAIHDHSIEHIARALSRYTLPSDALSALQQRYAQAENPDAYIRALAGERAFGASLFLAAYHGDPNTGNWGEAAQGAIGGIKPGSPVLLSDAADLLRAYDPILDNPGATWPLRLAQSRQALQELATDPAVNATVQPALARSTEAFARDAAGLRCVQTACAIEIFRNDHGRLPMNLTELVPEVIDAIPTDPFDGNPLRYKRQFDGYLVYSVYVNGVDDEGMDYKQTDQMKGGDYRFEVLR